MPIPILAEVLTNGLPFGISAWTIAKVVVLAAIVTVVKIYFNGARNLAERQMHSKVVMITGGTTGIGAATALAMAQRGAQIILLVRQPSSDPFLVDYIEDLRSRSGNHMVYAEQVDFSSLYSVRKFATKWVDNAPPRRLDMIIMCAATLTPPGGTREVTDEGIEETWAVNYLANFHLLSILSPAIRAQPPDRDVRIIFTTCSSYISAPPVDNVDDALSVKKWSPSKAYARSKFALMVFGQAFQKHLDAYKRPDSMPMNARVIMVDPGFSRTPGMRRWLTRGSLVGLAVYLWLWSQAWLFLKSAEQGAQSLLFAAMDVSLGRGPGGKLIKECIEVDYARKDVRDEAMAKKLWEGSEKLIERVEREEAVKRALAKKEKDATEQKAKKEETEKEETQKVDDEKKPKSRRQRKKAA
jgi:NAD(P)-dependent dehydrogenase (short-subunit alcohol dehydrogenase family)